MQPWGFVCVCIEAPVCRAERACARPLVLGAFCCTGCVSGQRQHSGHPLAACMPHQGRHASPPPRALLCPPLQLGSRLLIRRHLRQHLIQLLPEVCLSQGSLGGCQEASLCCTQWPWGLKLQCAKALLRARVQGVAAASVPGAPTQPRKHPPTHSTRTPYYGAHLSQGPPKVELTHSAAHLERGFLQAESCLRGRQAPVRQNLMVRECRTVTAVCIIRGGQGRKKRARCTGCQDGTFKAPLLVPAHVCTQKPQQHAPCP